MSHLFETKSIKQKTPASCQTSISASGEVLNSKSKHGNTHYQSFKNKWSFCPFTTTLLLTSDKATKQAYDTLQIKLDCSPLFSSKKLSQRHSKAGQADVTVVSKMRQTCVYQFYQRLSCICCLMQDTGENLIFLWVFWHH